MASALAWSLAVLAALISPTRPAPAETTAERLAAGVVGVRAYINPDGRTVGTLGAERRGTGIVIGADGLVVTIGYLMVEAQAAEITLSNGRRVAADLVGYDYDTGFGLLRATAPLDVKPIELGRSADLKAGDRVLVASAGRILPAHVAAKRLFAGYWEYLLEDALFTTPPYPDWSGAGLISRDGRLVGIGSLVVGDASGQGSGQPGNMFVPIDLLEPILAELLAGGTVAGPARPWIGITTDERDGALVVRRATADGPAEKAGLKPGDRIVAIGERTVGSLADLYRGIWALGTAGVMVPLVIERDGRRQSIEIRSASRRQQLRLDPRL
jgi:S1-C subfamily serine protease